jgi:uncharacterized glyoxalase superfamily protein PhnB
MVNYFSSSESRREDMNPAPAGWPRISPALYYQDAAKAIDWLCRVFAFEVRLKIEGEGGRIEHSELVFGEGLIMVDESSKRERAPYRRSPGEVGGANTQNLMLYVDDVDAHCKRAREAGARIVTEPGNHDYGEDYWADRAYECEDIGGHYWWFVQRLRSPK